MLANQHTIYRLYISQNHIVIVLLVHHQMLGSIIVYKDIDFLIPSQKNNSLLIFRKQHSGLSVGKERYKEKKQLQNMFHKKDVLKKTSGTLERIPLVNSLIYHFTLGPSPHCGAPWSCHTRSEFKTPRPGVVE